MPNKTILSSYFVEYFFKFIFTFINLLFIYKYGIRQNYITVYFVLFFYLIISGLLLYKDIFKLNFIKKFNLKQYYKILCFLLVSLIFLITFYTDGNSLNVDRWSAMDVAIRALLNGEYPYIAVDHMNGRTSNFPGLLILGIPFYLLGNVGYLQVFAFLILSYTLYKVLKIENAFRYIVLLLISPAFWWEIFAISDLMSNIILVLCFILLVKDSLKKDLFKYPIFLGISSSFLVLTRGVVAIPLTLLLFKDFWSISFSKKIKFMVSLILTSFLLIGLVIMNCPDKNTLVLYNPLVLQTHYLPSFVNVFALLLPFYFSYKIKSFHNDFFKASSILLLFPTFLSFINNWERNGLEILLKENKFDLSYLSIVIPFILFEIVSNSTPFSPPKNVSH